MTVLGVRLHCRRERALGDDARSKNCYRDEVGSGSKRGSERRVMPIRSLPSGFRKPWSKTGLPS